MTRDFYFDNVKSALITLVVIGHFLMPMEKTRLTETLIDLIYLFHMPMFAMVSGYFAKSVYQDGRYRTDKLFRLVWFYLVFKVCAHVTENLAAGTPITGRIDFFRESGAPWYLLAMVWWNLSIPCAAALKPQAVLAISLAIGLLSGYQDSIGSTLAMSRTMVFAPFFYAGYYWSGRRVKEYREGKARWLFVVAAAGTAAMAVLGAGSREVQKFDVIVYGMNYSRMAPELYPWGAVIRAGCYLGAAVMSLGLMAVIPKRKRFWTGLGERTLQIYILHRLFRDLMEYGGFYEKIASLRIAGVAGVLGLSVLATFVLGSAGFTWGFRQLQKIPDHFYGSWRQD